MILEKTYMNKKTKKVEYIEMYPDEFLKEVERFPIAYLSLGALEWHSYHLPLGFDGLKVEYFFKILAQKKGGIVFPTIHYGLPENIPHPASMVVGIEEFRKFLKSIIKGIISLGFKIIIIATGHWSTDQMQSLIDISEETMNNNCGVLMLGLPLVNICSEDGIIIDHAGKYETSIGMALFPDKVKIKRLGKKYLGLWKFPDEEQMIEFGIEDDEDPRVAANKKYGKKVLALMIKRYSEVIDEMLDGKKEKLIHYHQKTQEFINSNFSNLYKDLDPIDFYKQLEKKIKSKKYY